MVLVLVPLANPGRAVRFEGITWGRVAEEKLRTRVFERHHHLGASQLEAAQTNLEQDQYQQHPGV